MTTTTTIRRLDRRTPVSPTALQPEPHPPGRIASVRIPPRPGNRAYLRALRAAEAAAWEAAPGTLRPANFRGNRPGAPASRPARLPSATTDDQAEGRWHALLSLIAIGSVGFALWTSGALARHWSEITAAVQRLVGIS